MVFGIAIVVLLLGTWLSIREMPVMIGSVASSGVIRKTYMPFVLFLAVSLAFIFSGDITGNLNTIPNINHPLSAFIICFASAFSLGIFSFFTKWTSLVYSLVASLFALSFYSSGQDSLTFLYKSYIAWILAPFMSLFFSSVLFQLVKQSLRKIQLHLITLNIILRVLLTVVFFILVVSFAVNNGSLILSLTGSMKEMVDINVGKWFADGEIVGWIFFTVLITILYFYPVRNISARISSKFFDINTETVFVIILSVSLPLIFFSSNRLCSLIGITATPVSLVHLFLGAMFGISWSNRSMIIDKKEFYKSCLSILLLPALTFIVAYTILKGVNIETGFTNSSQGFSGTQRPFDITNFVLYFFLLLLFAVVIYFYIAKNRASGHARIKIAEDRSQMNEMQKAMVDLEIKVIQNENDNLHKRLEIKRKDLIDNALWIGQQRVFLEELSSDIEKLRTLEELDKMKVQIGIIEGKIKNKKAFSHEMNELYSQVEVLHKDFSLILHEKFPDLTEQQRRLATLLRLGFSTKELATIMSITPKSVEVCRYRLRKKMDLNRDDNLINFIKSL